MGKFVKFCGALLIAFVLVNLLYLWCMPGIDWEFRKTKEAAAFNNKQFRILVLGNSTAMDGVNTDLISQRVAPAYNFSVGGASLETNFVQLQHYLENNQAPETVLLFLSSAHVKYAAGKDLHPVVEYYYKQQQGFIGLSGLPLFKFRWLFVENMKKLFSATHRSAKLSAGQLQIKRAVKDNTAGKAEDQICLGNNDYNGEGYIYLWKIVELCRSKGINIKLFEMPLWKAFQNKCPDANLSNSGLHTGQPVALYNLNNAARCDTMLRADRDWLSKNHLNYSGSVQVTNAIIQLLTAK